MHNAAILLAVSMLGIDFGWQYRSDGQLTYIIQLEPELFQAMMEQGREIVSEIPPSLRGGDKFVIRVGRGEVPRVNPPAGFPNRGLSATRPDPPLRGEALRQANALRTAAQAPERTPGDPAPPAPVSSQPAQDPSPVADDDLIAPPPINSFGGSAAQPEPSSSTARGVGFSASAAPTTGSSNNTFDPTQGMGAANRFSDRESRPANASFQPGSADPVRPEPMSPGPIESGGTAEEPEQPQPAGLSSLRDSIATELGVRTDSSPSPSTAGDGAVEGGAFQPGSPRPAIDPPSFGNSSAASLEQPANETGSVYAQPQPTKPSPDAGNAGEFNPAEAFRKFGGQPRADASETDLAPPPQPIPSPQGGFRPELDEAKPSEPSPIPGPNEGRFSQALSDAETTPPTRYPETTVQDAQVRQATAYKTPKGQAPAQQPADTVQDRPSPSWGSASTEAPKPWMTLVLTSLALFASLGCNLYLGIVTYGFHARCRQLLTRLGESTGPANPTRSRPRRPSAQPG